MQCDMLRWGRLTLERKTRQIIFRIHVGRRSGTHNHNAVAATHSKPDSTPRPRTSESTDTESLVIPDCVSEGVLQHELQFIDPFGHARVEYRKTLPLPIGSAESTVSSLTRTEFRPNTEGWFYCNDVCRRDRYTFRSAEPRVFGPST